MSGPTVTILNSGGAGTTITWGVFAIDPAVNSVSTTCRLDVVPKGNCRASEGLELVGWIIDSNQVFQTCGPITTGDFHVLTGCEVTLRSGELISLGEGFSISSGAELVAEIDP